MTPDLNLFLIILIVGAVIAILCSNKIWGKKFLYVRLMTLYLASLLVAIGMAGTLISICILYGKQK